MGFVQMWIVAFSIPLFIIFLLLNVFSCDGKIDNLPNVVTWPYVGACFSVKRNACLRFWQWSRTYGPVYQVRMGTKRVIVANSYAAIRKLWNCNCRCNNSRPVSHTFHEVVSKSGQFTVGTTPAGTSYKCRRKYLASHMNQNSLKAQAYVIDSESSIFVRNFILLGSYLDTNVVDKIQQFSLNVSTRVTFGYMPPFDLVREIVEVENRILNARSHICNASDYIPLWRYFQSTTDMEKLRERRAKYMDFLIEFAQKNPSPCLVSQSDLSPEDLQSVCLTMVSAGLDNTGASLGYAFGALSHHLHLQEKAISEILRLYDQDANKAWTKCCLDGEVCDYIVAILEESLRILTVLPMGLPRVTTCSITYNGAVIPPGTRMFMNAWAANHDDGYFTNPYDFVPERWLDHEGKMLSKCTLNHFSFGTGSRMCLGNLFAFKEMYVCLVKMLLAFKIEKPDHQAMEMDPIELNANPSAVAIEPKQFQIRLRNRGLL